MNISEKIKNARLENGLTQEQAAEKLLVSRQTISNWENGKSLPDIISVIKMGELYELSLDDLLKGDKAMLKKIENDVRAAKAQKNVMKLAWGSIAAGIILVILGIVFEGNPIIDFVKGALPWVLLALMFLVSILYLNKEKEE